MGLKPHQQITIILIAGIFFLVLLVDIEATELYNPNSWANMSIAFGASILTVVGIITSVITSNVNNRRAEFIDVQNNILEIVEERERLIQDDELNKYYKDAKNKITELIDERAPMKYSESYIGFASFFSFLMSVILAIYGAYYKLVFGAFLLGIGLIISYISYCLIEFWKIDQYSFFPDKQGKLEISSIKVNGKDEQLLDNMGDKVRVLLLPENVRINIIELKITFKGKIRNGFLHSIVKYTDGSESHIPDRYTSLLGFGFIKDFMLTTINGIDTGMLHSKNPIELLMRIIIRSPKGANNKFLMRRNIPPYGDQDIYTFCSVSNNMIIDNINIRMYEDPLFRPKYKRRAVDLITIKVTRTVPKSKRTSIISKPSGNILLDDNFEYSDPDIFAKSWHVVVKNQGKALLTDEIGGVLGSKTCLKIESTTGSNAYVKREFKESKKVHIEYYLRQNYLSQQKTGSPFIIESPVNIGGGIGKRVVYMEIVRGYLNHKIPPENICEIIPGKWYKIELIVDCVKHTYTYKIDDQESASFKFRNEFTSVNALRTKHFGGNEIWATYIDAVKVIEIN